jgi:Flp pilus assembly protein TadD
MNAVFLLILSVVLLGACESTDVSVQPPPQTHSAPSNLKNSTSAPRIERQLYNPAQESGKDIDDEDDATAALLKTAERMVAAQDFTSANVLYQRALGTNPESITALNGLAHMAELQEKPQQALQAYREIIRIDGDNADAHRGVAKNMMTLGLYDKAVEQLNKLRALSGDDVETLNLQGMAYTRDEKFNDAETCFKTALGIDADNIKTQNNLGFTYIMAGQLDDAIAVFEKLTDDTRATVQHRQNLALAYGLAGREKDARSMAMQDLPKAAVEKNILSYRKMRTKAKKPKQ